MSGAGVTDFFFHKELTTGQRFGRIAVGVLAAGLVVAAVPIVLSAVGVPILTGAAAFAVETGTAFAIGYFVDRYVTRPRVYPLLGLGQ